MTDTKSGAREFWIQQNNSDDDTFWGINNLSIKEKYFTDNVPVHHVIEFSAYQKALDEIELFKKLLERARVKIERQHDALIATKELLDENARLKTLLGEI